MTDEKTTFHLFSSGIGFQILRVFQSFLHWFIVCSTALVVARTILVIILARWHTAPPTLLQRLPSSGLSHYSRLQRTKGHRQNHPVSFGFGI